MGVALSILARVDSLLDKGQQVLADHAVQHNLLGRALAIGGRRRLDGGAGETLEDCGLVALHEALKGKGRAMDEDDSVVRNSAWLTGLPVVREDRESGIRIYVRLAGSFTP